MGDPNGGSVFVSLWSLGSLLGICGEALSCCGCGTAKKYSQAMRCCWEREKKIQEVRPVRWGVCIKVLNSSGPGSPVFVGINVRFLFRSYGFFFGNEYIFLKRFREVTNILVLRDSPCGFAWLRNNPKFQKSCGIVENTYTLRYEYFVEGAGTILIWRVLWHFYFRGHSCLIYRCQCPSVIRIARLLRENLLASKNNPQ